MGGEQGFESLAQGGIAMAGAIQEYGGAGFMLGSDSFIYQIKRSLAAKSMWKNFDILSPRFLRLLRVNL